MWDRPICNASHLPMLEQAGAANSCLLGCSSIYLRTLLWLQQYAGPALKGLLRRWH